MNEHDQRAWTSARPGLATGGAVLRSPPAAYILEALHALGVRAHRDGFGNIIAHYIRTTGNGQPPIAFVAHMDHPGFEITEAGEHGIIARALGACR